MQLTARDAYLTTEVTTATPQKLQLMLIEAAIRFCRQAQAQRQNDQEEQAGEAIIRCQEVISELLIGLRPDRDAELVRRVASVYVYLLRTLTLAHVERQSAALDDAIRVLEIERGTWQQVCLELGSRIDAGVAGHAFVA